jgi:hypothetical protein
MKVGKEKAGHIRNFFLPNNGVGKNIRVHIQDLRPEAFGIPSQAESQ